MATCRSCGRAIGFLEATANVGHCDDCFQKETQARVEKRNSASTRASGPDTTDNAAIEAVLLTTETAPNLPIAERIEIVTAECAFGMNIFKDLFASVRDIVGGRSRAVQNTMRDARRTALFELKREAWLVGADAVVGVDLDYVELSSAGSMVMLVASGTAVRLADQ
ncbi:MAG: YbjQ family protein [Rhodobacter sp.]|nr:YbjQ family protein [Rhodobacter sp.]